MIGALVNLIPQKLVAEVVGVVLEITLVAAVTGYYVHKHDKAHEAATVAAIHAQEQAAIDAALARANSAESDLATERKKSHVVYQTITHEVDHVVDRPVYLRDCIDSDGLRLANAALTGQVASAAAAASAVPASVPASGNDGR
jgi:hypothetical protein